MAFYSYSPILTWLLALALLPGGWIAGAANQDSVPAALAGAKTVASDPLESEAEDESAAESKNPPRYSYKKYLNVVYSRGKDYRLLCDIYKPLGPGPFPAVLAIHGGAWSHGSKLQMMLPARKMSASGYVVIAINYRLAPKYKFPAQIQDCKRTVRWIRSNSEKLNVNPEQVAAFGYSAGGHLSAMLGTTDAQDQLDGELPPDHEYGSISSRVQCVVVGGGPCEFDWIKSQALVHWLGVGPEEDPTIYLQASPITYVSEDDPPFIFFHGSGDRVVPPSSSRKMHEQLLAAGVESRYQSVPDKGHLATFGDTRWVDAAIEFMDAKLNRTHDE